MWFLSTPLSAQRPTSGGDSDRERGQWDCHHSLLATPSRRGAEWGGPRVQGNNNKNNNNKMSLSHVWASGTRIVEAHKRSANTDSDKADKRDNAQTWKGNEFLAETHLCLCRSCGSLSGAAKSERLGGKRYETLPPGGDW